MDSNYLTSDYIKIEPSTSYFLNWTTKKWYCFYDANKNFISYASNTQFTSSENALYIRITAELTELDTLQLEKGIEETEYNKYYEPVTTYIYLDEPLRKIGDCNNCSDYIDFEKGQVVRYVKKQILNGTESWSLPRVF